MLCNRKSVFLDFLENFNIFYRVYKYFAFHYNIGVNFIQFSIDKEVIFMKIEKVNDNQIRCTLTRADLDDRHLKLSELAYGMFSIS